MAETKDDIARERDALKTENALLRSQLSALSAGHVATPQFTFQLSEGDRQELAARGAVNLGGRLMTRDEVRAKLPEGQRGIDLGDGPVDRGLQAVIDRRADQGATRGVDYVWPSVAPGQIDPNVAGTPGINGPAAGTPVPDDETPAPTPTADGQE